MKPGKLWLENITAVQNIGVLRKKYLCRRFRLSRRRCGRTKSSGTSVRVTAWKVRTSSHRRSAFVVEGTAVRQVASSLKKKALRSYKCRKPQTNITASHYIRLKYYILCQKSGKHEALSFHILEYATRYFTVRITGVLRRHSAIISVLYDVILP